MSEKDKIIDRDYLCKLVHLIQWSNSLLIAPNRREIMKLCNQLKRSIARSKFLKD